MEIKISTELRAKIEDYVQRQCWDWVLFELHFEENAYAGGVELYAQRTIPRPIEAAVDDEGKVYDPSELPEDAVDGLDPPATSYPGPVDAVGLVEHTSEDGRRVSSLAVDLRRFGGGGVSVDIYARVPADTRYERVLSSWFHETEPDVLGFPKTKITFDFFGDIETIGIATSAGGSWVVPPSAVLPNGLSATSVSWDQVPGTQVDESFENSVLVGDMPAAPAVIYDSSQYFVDAEAQGPSFSTMLFGQYEVVNITYHSPSGLVETIEATSVSWTGYIPNLDGHRVEMRRVVNRWYPTPSYSNVPIPKPLTIEAEARIAPGFGDLPFTAVKVAADDGTTASADHTRWAIIEGEGSDAVRFIGTYKAADVTLETTSDNWRRVGTLTIFPCERAAGFSLAG